MAETAQTEATPDKPTAYGWCTWHKGTAAAIRLISAIEQGSGPGVSLFACGPCRDVYGLVPLTDR